MEAAQDRAIIMIADKGSCVIVGRAADHVLRSRSNVVLVFIHAPKDYRVKNVMEIYGDAPLKGKRASSGPTPLEARIPKASPVMRGATHTSTR